MAIACNRQVNYPATTSKTLFFSEFHDGNFQNGKFLCELITGSRTNAAEWADVDQVSCFSGPNHDVCLKLRGGGPSHCPVSVQATGADQVESPEQWLVIEQSEIRAMFNQNGFYLLSDHGAWFVLARGNLTRDAQGAHGTTMWRDLTFNVCS